MQYTSTKICTWQMRSVALLILVILVGIALPCDAAPKILFQDNFEGKSALRQRVIDETKWMIIPSWKLSNNEDEHKTLGKKVLDIWGHGVGVSVDDFPEEYDYYADFKAMDGSEARFAFHVQEDEHGGHPVLFAFNGIYNYYSVSIAMKGARYWSQKIGWACKLARNNGWRVFTTPFADRRDRQPDIWYRVKIEVRAGHKFYAYLGEVGAAPEEMVFVGTWTDAKKRFAHGKIGFSMTGDIEWGKGTRSQFDNIVVTTPNFYAVAPKDKLTMTWGELKQK